jgi:hypothetical protein
MKIILIRFFNPKKYLFSLLTVGCCVALLSKPAYSQIDYSYGLNKKGFRISLGLGGNMIQSTWDTKPIGYTLLSSLSYDFSNYFSIVAESQYGSMTGIDGSKTFAYSKSTNAFTAASITVRFSLGLLSDFESQTGFTDAIKRSYIGIGYGALFSKVTLTKAPSSSLTGQTVEIFQTSDPSVYKSTKVYSTTMIPFNIGTNIAMPGVWGADKVEINPNIQYNLFKEAFADGYQPQSTSTNGGYTLLSVSLRYKF